jgi:hypothetical protein
MPASQGTYSAMLVRMAYQHVPPESWSVLLVDLRAFVDPLVADEDGQLDAWDPTTQTWLKAG